ncbi:hypothetical protein AAMO2058_001443200 [Amorphochlora amoebiformis]
MKRLLNKTVGGYHSGAIDDKDFEKRVKRFRRYSKNLDDALRFTGTLWVAMRSMLQATVDLMENQEELAMSHPPHPRISEISKTKESMDEFAKSELPNLLKRLEEEVKNQLEDRKEETRAIEIKLAKRLSLRDDYTYYLGKVEKLSGLHKEHLRKGTVEKIKFTEKLERNELKVQQSKLNFEARSKALEKELKHLLKTYPEKVQVIAIEGLSIQRTLHLKLAEIFGTMSINCLYTGKTGAVEPDRKAPRRPHLADLDGDDGGGEDDKDDNDELKEEEKPTSV